MLSTLCKSGPPLFFMISGALLLGKKESFQVILKHKVFRFGLILLITTVWMSRGDFNIQSFVHNLLTNNNWFLYAYLAFLFMLPFLRILVQNLDKKMLWLFLILSTIFYTMTSVLMFFGITNQWALFPVIYTSDWPSKCWHIVFPIAGYFFANEDALQVTVQEKRMQRRVIIGGTVLSLALSVVFLTFDISLHNGVNLEALREFFVMVPSFFLFLLVKDMSEKWEEKISVRARKIINCVAQATFGVFLLNLFTPIKSWVYDSVGTLASLYIGDYLSWIVAIVIEFIISTVIICIVRKVPLLNKLL